MPGPEDAEEIASLRAELEAARRTIDALTARVETLDGNAPEEAGAMARALAGMQRELAHRTRTLEETEATYRALYESTPDPLLTIDGAGVVFACNRTGLDWLGLPIGEVVGQPLADLFHEREGPLLARMVEVSWTGVSERRFTLRGGRRISLNVVRILGTSPERFHVTIRDVTDREVLEEAGDERRRMAALSELARDVTRELNDPMSIVQGRLELLLELGDNSAEDTARHLAVALRHARRISATLQNLRLVGSTHVPHLGRAFLAEALAEATSMLGSRLDKITVHTDIDPAELAAGGDHAMYVRVLYNLMDRLLDFCGADGRLRVTARPESGGVRVQLIGGPQMPPLTELVPPPKGDEGALERVGLGVTLAKTMVTAMGGRLEARSKGQRAMYQLDLPDAPTKRARARPVEAKLLVVGSDKLLHSVDDLLAREGFGLETVPDAEAALARLDQDAELDGVVTELLLPGVSGLSLVSVIDRLHARMHGKVVLVSETKSVPAPESVTVLQVPLRRAELLAALGRRIRRR